MTYLRLSDAVLAKLYLGGVTARALHLIPVKRQGAGMLYIGEAYYVNLIRDCLAAWG